MTEYPLPKASQEQFSKYYKQRVKRGTLSKYEIVWVGNPLPCRFKSEETKSVLSAQNVFIFKKDNKFEYGVIDSSNTTYKLPKKFFTICFPNIGISSVPENNRYVMQLSQKSKQILPFIPDSFLEQKKLKTNRKRRRMYHNIESQPVEDVESINFAKKIVPSWYALQVEDSENVLIKKEIVHLIRYLVRFTDTSAFELHDPFENLTSLQDLKNNAESMHTFKIILSFVYHYCRRELGLHTNVDMSKSVTTFVEALNSALC